MEACDTRERDGGCPVVSQHKGMFSRDLVRLISGEWQVVDGDFALVHTPGVGYYLKHRRTGLVSRAFPTDRELQAMNFRGELEYLGYYTD